MLDAFVSGTEYNDIHQFRAPAMTSTEGQCSGLDESCRHRGCNHAREGGKRPPCDVDCWCHVKPVSMGQMHVWQAGEPRQTPGAPHPATRMGWGRSLRRHVPRGSNPAGSSATALFCWSGVRGRLGRHGDPGLARRRSGRQSRRWPSVGVS